MGETKSKGSLKGRNLGGGAELGQGGGGHDELAALDGNDGVAAIARVDQACVSTMAWTRSKTASWLVGGGGEGEGGEARPHRTRAAAGRPWNAADIKCVARSRRCANIDAANRAA